jgi:hypothetical protein
MIKTGKEITEIFGKNAVLVVAGDCAAVLTLGIVNNAPRCVILTAPQTNGLELDFDGDLKQALEDLEDDSVEAIITNSDTAYDAPEAWTRAAIFFEELAAAAHHEIRRAIAKEMKQRAATKEPI